MKSTFLSQQAIWSNSTLLGGESAHQGDIKEFHDFRGTDMQWGRKRMYRLVYACMFWFVCGFKTMCTFVYLSAW
jgi:hypothetical protein